MTSNQVRQTFLEFFRDRDHRVVASSSLVPAGDPTLLFTNAGMNQFKDVFLGRGKRNYVRATTCQKCVRAGGKHNDLEQVGRTARHHTFFEMLGNFSFGDYFKADAIPFAWDLITNPTEGYGISANKLYATIFEGQGDIPRDAEAYDLWRAVGVPPDRIFELGMKDNFWQMGDTGPCGPCSEIHYDQGAAASEEGHTDCRFPCDCGRYVELWNLVFMQFNRDESGTMTPLPRPSIDTGAGLERISAVLQGKLSNFDTDLFRPLIEEAALMAKAEYGSNHEADVSLRIIADHARASTFLISDGVLPSNEGRGYVLRLIMRRALYHGQTLGLNEPFLFKLSGKVVDMMKGAYPELIEAAQHVAKAIKVEEERYEHTTRVGIERLGEASVVSDRQTEIPFEKWREWYSDYARDNKDLAMLMAQHQLPFVESLFTPSTKSALRTGGAMWIPGQDLFKLHDTFGLRPDFVADIVKDYGLTVDLEGYEAEMQKQRERARASWKGVAKPAIGPAFQQVMALGMQTDFLGYSTTKAPACQILSFLAGSVAIPAEVVYPGDQVEIILERTPFYAESGGQVGDTGKLFRDGQPVAEIHDAYRPLQGVTAHRAKILQELRVSEAVDAVVDAERREAIVRNHTATHLLHAALRKVLGTHVKQAGSLVAPDHLRFDFSHYASVDHQDLTDIEDLVNEHTLGNDEIRTEVMGIDQALASGAMALFGEKYGDRVRVVSVGDGSFSRELCGGTHVERTGEIGLFKLTSEGSVSAGTRRVEALTGTGLLENMRRRLALLHEIESRLKAKPDELIATLERLEESEKKARKELKAFQRKQAMSINPADYIKQVGSDNIPVYAARTEAGSREVLREMVDDLRKHNGLHSGAIVLGGVIDGKVALIASVSKDLISRLDAGKIVRAAAAMVDGSGGGRKDLAEAGGKSPEKLPALMEALPGIVAGMLK